MKKIIELELYSWSISYYKSLFNNVEKYTARITWKPPVKGYIDQNNIRKKRQILS